jgi:glucosamine--fructose-6-phosphate aminotransferase (isomerizing)
MSGIFGYSGTRDALPLVMAGLRRLEYKGCDSAGLGWIPSGEIHEIQRCRAVGRVSDLERFLGEQNIRSLIASPDQGPMAVLGHTRWGTQGAPLESHAHPHTDAVRKLAVVHNGLFENHQILRRALIKRGISFEGETDSETFAKLLGIQYNSSHDPETSLRLALSQIQGAYGIAVLFADRPGEIWAVQCGSRLVVGVHESKQEYWIASDPTALVGQASQMVELRDKEIAVIGPGGLKIFPLHAEAKSAIARNPDPLELSVKEIELGSYPHYMIQEIHDQPHALRRCLAGRLDSQKGEVRLGGLTALESCLADLKRITLFGCGTAWHAGQVAQILFEDLARIPAEVRYASELRHRNPVVEPGTLAVAISQSGETEDTVAALNLMMLKGATGFGVVNRPGSAVARNSQAGAFLHAGEERGVASTKSFTAQVAVLTMMALELGRRRHLAPRDAGRLLVLLEDIPRLMDRTLALDQACRELAEKYYQQQNWVLLGRGISYPVALEGALKLKEIAGIHAEGIPAAEIKHGPIALVDQGMPVVLIAPRESLRAEVVANMQEVKNRGGKMILVATNPDPDLIQLADHSLTVPDVDELLSPLLTSIPLQLLAYHIAVKRGLAVDRA